MKSEFKPFYPLDTGTGSNGRVYAANEESINQALLRGGVTAANDQNVEGYHLSQPLTEFATGVSDDNGLEALLDALFPSVPVGMRFSYLQHDETAQFIADSVSEIIRPIGGEHSVVKRNGTEAEGRVYNMGLTTYVDHDQGGLLPATQRMHVQGLINRINRSELAYGLALIDAAAIEEGSTNWGSATSNPDGDVRTSLRNARLIRGMKSNLVVYGNAAWESRALAYEQAGRTNNSGKADYTTDRLASMLSVDRVVDVDAVKRSSATALADMMGSVVYNYNARPGLTMDDPSNVKRFMRMTEQGKLRVFIEYQTNRVKITVDRYSNIIVTSTLGIRKRTVTYS